VNFFTPAEHARPTHQPLCIPTAISTRHARHPSDRHHPAHHSEFLTATSVPMPVPKTRHSMISSFAPENSASQRQLLVDPEQNPKQLQTSSLALEVWILRLLFENGATKPDWRRTHWIHSSDFNGVPAQQSRLSHWHEVACQNGRDKGLARMGLEKATISRPCSLGQGECSQGKISSSYISLALATDNFMQWPLHNLATAS